MTKIVFNTLFYEPEIAKVMSTELCNYLGELKLFYLPKSVISNSNNPYLQIPSGFSISYKSLWSVPLLETKIKEIEEKYKEHAYHKHMFKIKEKHIDMAQRIIKDVEHTETTLVDDDFIYMYVYAKENQYTKQLFILTLIAH